MAQRIATTPEQPGDPRQRGHGPPAGAPPPPPNPAAHANEPPAPRPRCRPPALRRPPRGPGLPANREPAPRLSGDRGYDADRQLLRLEHRSLLDVHLEIPQQFAAPMSR